MKTIKNKEIALVHFGKREKSGLQILEKLTQHKFNVKQWDVLSGNEKLQGIELVDAIVVNIGEVNFDYDNILSNLFEKEIKIIINEAGLIHQLTGSKRKSWERHLLNKIDSSFSILPDISEQEEIITTKVDFKSFGINQVWVLIASIGGPEAIQKFLKEFDGDESIVFIIIQHIDKEFLPMLEQQLINVSRLDVHIPISGMSVKPSLCYLCPTDEYLQFLHNGIIELTVKTEVTSYTPCIDETTKKLLHNVENINMAVFSGMSSDGIKAAELVKELGMKVITQTESSCVLSTIIDGVKQKVEIDFEGTPQEMASYIKKNLESING